MEKHQLIELFRDWEQEGTISGWIDHDTGNVAKHLLYAFLHVDSFTIDTGTLFRILDGSPMQEHAWNYGIGILERYGDISCQITTVAGTDSFKVKALQKWGTCKTNHTFLQGNYVLDTESRQMFTGSCAFGMIDENAAAFEIASILLQEKRVRPLHISETPQDIRKGLSGLMEDSYIIPIQDFLVPREHFLSRIKVYLQRD